jgi:PKD domain
MRTLARVVLAAWGAGLVAGCEQPAQMETPEQTRPAQLEPRALAVPVDALLARAERFQSWRAQYLAEADLTRRAQLLENGVALAVARRAAMEELVRHHPLLALQAALSAEELAALPEAISSLLERRLDAVGTVGVQGVVGDDGAGVFPVAVVGGRTLRATGPGAENLLRPRENVRLSGVLTGEWVALEADGDGAGGEPLASAYTEGPKTVLYIRVDFSDLPGEPLSEASAQTTMDGQVAPFYDAQSYGRTTITSTTVTPVLRMPQTLAWYKTNGDYQLQTDARAAARAAGFDRANFSFDITAFARVAEWGYAGKAWVGAPGVWLNGYFNMSVTAHELGHNWGVAHANRWNATGDSIVGAGTHSEYGNQFDVMGGGPNGWAHFNAEFKKRLNWVVAGEVSTVTTSGTYRLHALESAIASGFHTLSVARPDGKTYWMEFRTQVPSNASAASGAFLMWNVPTGGRGNEVLDVSPATSGTDSALVLGRTFSDAASGIHLTPIGKGGTSPESLDVVVQLGAFASNNRPAATLSASATAAAVGESVTFTAAATDGDGDALAYGWDFGDGTVSASAAQVTRSFPAARDVRVRVTATDMKGGLSSRSVLLRVGSPTTFRLSGRVLAGGQPLAEVRVTDGTRSAYSDDDGTFTLVGVPAGSPTLSAIKPGFSFAAGFANPVAVSANVANLDFTATSTAAVRTLSGRVLDGTNAIAGAVVSDGTRSATSDASGNWTLANVPEGFVTLTATRAGWAFAASGFTNPLQVLGGDLTGLNFASTGVRIYGAVTGASVPTTISDGYRTAQTVLSGSTWSYNIGPMPAGSYTLTATTAGYTVTPGFANPVVVSTSNVTGRNFTATPSGTTFSVGGTVTTSAGAALAGVVVSDGARTATTDAAGAYLIGGVPAGSYTLTPQRAGYTFAPASLSVSVSTANVAAQNFTATALNQAPSIASAAAANPNPVTGASAAVSVLGTDDAGEAALTYTWSATGPAAVTFSANGSNAAKNATATFSRAGSYALAVTVRDAAGLTASSSVNVTVQQTVTALSVSPASASVPVSGTQQFLAAATDQFGQSMTASASWSVSGGGSISTAGLFAAGASVGGPFTVTAQASGRSGTAQVTITSGAAPTIAAAASASPSPVTGTTASLSVLGADDGGEAALLYTWSATGPAPVSFSANGSNAAKNATGTFSRAGSYLLQVVIRDVGGLTATSSVSVTVQQTVSAVSVTPATAQVMVGGAQQFAAAAVDQFAQAMNPAPVFTWSVSGGGALSQSGLFTAGNTAGGPFTVSASAQGRTGSGSVTVTPGSAPTVASAAAANPNPVTSRSAALTVLGADDQGEAALVYTWSATGPAPVSFSANGSNAAKSTTATFGRAGSYVLQVSIADAAGLTVTSSVTVVVQATLARLAVAPALVTVGIGGTASFSASGFDQFDQPLIASVAWAVSGGGAISSAGVFTAGSTAGGPFNVTASAGGVFGFAQVSVKHRGRKPRIMNLADGAALSGTVTLAIDAVDSTARTLALTVDGQTVVTVDARSTDIVFDTAALTNGSRSLAVLAIDDEGPIPSDPVVVVVDNPRPNRGQPVEGVVFGGCSATGSFGLGALQLLALFAFASRRRRR